MARGVIAGLIGGGATAVLAAGAVSLAVGMPEHAMLRLPESDADGFVQSVAQDDATNPEPARIAPQAERRPADGPDAGDTPAPSGGAAAGGGASSDDASGLEGSGENETARASRRDPDRPGRKPPADTRVGPLAPPNAALSAPDLGNRDAATETRPPAMPRADTAPSILPKAPADASLAPPTSVATDDGPEMPRAQAEVPGFMTVEPDTAPAQPPSPPLPAVGSPLTEQAEPLRQEPSNEDAATELRDDTAVPPQLAEGETVSPPADDRPTIGEPAKVLADRDGSTAESRLFGIDVKPAEAATSDDESPLQDYAADVDVADDLPRLAVVLIDDGRGPLGPDALQAFPFPVSFAIDPSHPDAAQAAQEYRKLGYEVLTIAALPADASPRDVEVSLAGALDAVPQAVAVLEAPGGGLQGGSEVAQQVASFLSASGHGLIAVPNGLNTAQQIATRDGVPSATLFRDFDSEGQDARVIRRFLDQGAFRARQEGAVVMLGRLRADTISALVLWGLQDRAQSVALVPVSVVLQEAQTAR